jgi:hypothetical protein
MSISAENSTVSGTSVRLLLPDSTGEQEILQQTWSNHGLLTATFCSLGRMEGRTNKKKKHRNRGVLD